MIISIRFFENKLFYDPLIPYFKTDFLNKPLPEIDSAKLFISYFFRFSLTSILTIFILILLFTKSTVLAFSRRFFSISFIVLISLFFLNYYFLKDNTQLLFYIRRFIIQPLFLVLLIPAFYYQKQQEKH
jgi:exosortase F-associated protein